MHNFDVVFEKLTEVTQEETPEREVTVQELDEIEELRRFSAELREPEPVSLTTTS